MKKSIIFTVLIVVIIASVLLTGCTTKSSKEYGTQLLTFSNETSNFNYADLNAAKEEWNMEAGNDASVSSVFGVSSNGLSIDATAAGYAVASQKVFLKAYSYYKISYSYTTTSMSEFSTEDDATTWVGLYVGFLENKDFNISDTDKKSEIREAASKGTDSFYFKTDGTKEFNLAIYLGLENYPVKATATIHDIKLERVYESEAVENGATTGLYQLESAVYGQATTLNIVYVILGGVGTLLLAYIFYALRARSLAFDGIQSKNNFFEKLVNSKWLGIVITLGVAALIRLIITMVETIIAGSSYISQNYFGFDLEQNATLGSQLANWGTTTLYQKSQYTALLPFAMYIANLAGLIGRALGAMGLSSNGVAVAVVCCIKLFAILADLGTVALIYLLVAKRQGNVAGTIMASAYALTPVIFSMSAGWGAMESISAFLIVFAFYFVLNKKSYIGMVCCYFAACMVSVSALYVVPAVLFYTGYVIYKAIKDKEYKKLIAPSVALVAGFVLFYLVTLPFVINLFPKEGSFVAFDKYIATVKGLDVYSANAFNFQGLLGNNFKAIGLQSIFVTILFICFVAIVLGIAYFRNRNRLDLVLVAAVFVVAIWTFANDMSHYSLYVALPLLFIVTALLKDVRLYIGYTLYAAFAFVNNAYMYMVAGYTDNGVVQLSYDTTAMMYVFGAISLLLAVYLIVVSYDVLVNRKAVTFPVIKVTYGNYVMSIAKNIGIGIKNTANKTGAFVAATGEAIKEISAERKMNRKLRKSENSPVKEEEEEEIEE